MSVFDDLGLDRATIEAGIARFKKLKEARKELEPIQIKRVGVVAAELLGFDQRADSHAVHPPKPRTGVLTPFSGE